MEDSSSQLCSNFMIRSAMTSVDCRPERHEAETSNPSSMEGYRGVKGEWMVDDECLSLGNTRSGLDSISKASLSKIGSNYPVSFPLVSFF